VRFAVVREVVQHTWRRDGVVLIADATRRFDAIEASREVQRAVSIELAPRQKVQNTVIGKTV
jgi:hypothetical protein